MTIRVCAEKGSSYKLVVHTPYSLHFLFSVHTAMYTRRYSTLGSSTHIRRPDDTTTPNGSSRADHRLSRQQSSNTRLMHVHLSSVGTPRPFTPLWSTHLFKSETLSSLLRSIAAAKTIHPIHHDLVVLKVEQHL